MVLLLKVYSSFAFWTTFAIIHIFGCLYLSSQIYYMGRVRFGKCNAFSYSKTNAFFFCINCVIKVFFYGKCEEKSLKHRFHSPVHKK